MSKHKFEIVLSYMSQALSDENSKQEGKESLLRLWDNDPRPEHDRDTI